MLEIIKIPANCFLPLGSANIICRLRVNLHILLLLCKAISLDYNKDSRICPQLLTFLVLPLRWATFQQAHIWPLISPFGGLESCKKSHYEGDSPTTIPLPLLILTCSQCSYCFWSFFCMYSLVVHCHNYTFSSPERMWLDSMLLCVTSHPHSTLRKSHLNYPFKWISWSTLKAQHKCNLNLF